MTPVATAVYYAQTHKLHVFDGRLRVRYYQTHQVRLVYRIRRQLTGGLYLVEIYFAKLGG